MNNYIVVKEAHKVPATLQVENPIKLETLQKIVDGYIEEIRLPNGYSLICDEEGRYKGKKPCMEIHIDGSVIPICGTIVICKVENEDYCTMSYKEADGFIKSFVR